MKSMKIVPMMCALGLSAGLAFAAGATGTSTAENNPNPSWDDQWPNLESEFLSLQTQLTSETKFLKAGESYFSPDGRMMIFQAIEIPEEGQEADKYYSMYVATFKRDDDGNIIGLNKPGLVSLPGSANTCGWFNSNDPMKIIFGSTIVPPSDDHVAGFQRKTSKYAWDFPVEMEITSGELIMTYMLSDEAEKRAKELAKEDKSKTPEISISDIVSVPTLKEASTPIWHHDGYDAEGSWSPDGRYILFTSLEPGSNNGDIYIYDSTDGSQTLLVGDKGYDGGPFFSPDGKSICYRSDRRGDNLLQIYVADLVFEDSGKIVGIENEIQLSDNEHVNWCPFYTPDGKYLFFATSQMSHANYEIFAIDASGDYPLDETPRLRITKARGFDGLPAFSSDGQWMIWTAQRGASREGEDHPSSQIWSAKVDLDAVDSAYKAARKKLIDAKEAAEFENYTPED